MSKIILEQENETIHFNFEDLENPIDAVHILTSALVHLVKEYETVKNKEDFLRIMEIYYNEEI